MVYGSGFGAGIIRHFLYGFDEALTWKIQAQISTSLKCSCQYHRQNLRDYLGDTGTQTEHHEAAN